MAGYRTRLDRVLSTDFQDPFMSHQFVIESASIGANSNKFAAIFPGRFFQERTEAIDLPFKNIAAESRHVQATNRYYAGLASFNGFSATFFEKSDCSTMRAFVEWQKLIVDAEGNYNPATMYQAKFVLRLLQDNLNPNNATDRPVQTVELWGVFPTQINNISLTGSEMTRIAVQVQFSVNTVNWI